MRKPTSAGQRAAAELLPAGSRVGLSLVPIPLGRAGRSLRKEFDGALGSIHYAGACQRVGRCMRLLVVDGMHWVGGIVLGSTFPNIDCRDEALDLKRYVRGTRERGLASPWSAENTEYWSRLQSVVNHARTFVFPSAQGRGVGIEAHRLLLGVGIRQWKRRYPGPVAALDTLCDNRDSGLFRRNSWAHVGQTKGFGSDRTREFSASDRSEHLRNNVGLIRNSRAWEVWVVEVGP
jgi:hypothetical protein